MGYRKSTITSRIRKNYSVFVLLHRWLEQMLFFNNAIFFSQFFLNKYFLGPLHNSTFTLEFIHSLSNLIVLFNDLLMCSGKCMHLKFPQFESKLKIWLTIVEYTETLFEISAKKLWGQSGKWFIIIVIQIFK